MLCIVLFISQNKLEKNWLYNRRKWLFVHPIPERSDLPTILPRFSYTRLPNVFLHRHLFTDFAHVDHR